MSSSGRPFSSRDATAPRAVQLQKDVQSYCEKFAGNLKESLQQALQDSISSAPEAASHSDNAVESAILIGERLVHQSLQPSLALLNQALSLLVAQILVGMSESVIVVGAYHRVLKCPVDAIVKVCSVDAILRVSRSLRMASYVGLQNLSRLTSQQSAAFTASNSRTARSHVESPHRHA